MKLLLTSNGFSNQAIADALFELAGRKAEELNLVFIPTASNVEMGDKDWLIDDLVAIKKQNFKSIFITDISAVPEHIWRPQLEKADVLFFAGGNTFHLMEWVNKSGLANLLPELLKTKVYAGVSAGSMITSPNLLLNTLQKLYKENLEKTENMEALNFVDFYVLPHYKSSHFSLRSKENITEATKDITKKIYALDDQSALNVIDGKVEHVGGGQYLEFN